MARPKGNAHEQCLGCATFHRWKLGIEFHDSRPWFHSSSASAPRHELVQALSRAACGSTYRNHRHWRNFCGSVNNRRDINPGKSRFINKKENTWRAPCPKSWAAWAQLHFPCERADSPCKLHSSFVRFEPSMERELTDHSGRKQSGAGNERKLPHGRLRDSARRVDDCVRESKFRRNLQNASHNYPRCVMKIS